MELTFEEEIFGRCNAFGVCRNKKREIILLDHPVCQAKSKSFPETSQTVDDESNFIFDLLLYLYDLIARNF